MRSSTVSCTLLIRSNKAGNNATSAQLSVCDSKACVFAVLKRASAHAKFATPPFWLFICHAHIATLASTCIHVFLLLTVIIWSGVWLQLTRQAIDGFALAPELVLWPLPLQRYRALSALSCTSNIMPADLQIHAVGDAVPHHLFTSNTTSAAVFFGAVLLRSPF